jgi:hypothetical protein
MSPLLSRRRSRRRSMSGRIALLVLALIVVSVLIGGLAQVSRQSHTYDANTFRSLAAQGSVLADESNVTARSVRHLLGDMQKQDRLTLQADLDAVVQEAGDQSAGAARAGGQADGTVGGRFSSVFAERAQAVSQLRAAVDGLLGMHPLPVAGVPASGGRASTPTLLTSVEATDRIAAAGSLLARSDQTYRSVRHEVAGSAGHAQLPASVWVTDSQVWQPGAVAAQVDLVESSTSLAATHYLVLRTVRLTPQALPTATLPPAGTSVLPPTTAVEVSVVLSDLGSVDEPHATVQFSLTPQPTAAPLTRILKAAVVSGASITLALVHFAVKPGHAYQLTVSIVPPAAQTDLTGTSVTQVLDISPGT